MRPVPSQALPAALPALLRAAETMPDGASAWAVMKVLEARLPGDNADAVTEVAAELLACATAGARNPVPLLRMAETALHLASRRIAYAAWRDAGFPAQDPAADHMRSVAWEREHAGPSR